MTEQNECKHNWKPVGMSDNFFGVKVIFYCEKCQQLKYTEINYAITRPNYTS